MSLARLGTVSFIVGLIGAGGSVGLMLAARQQAPYSLVALFVIWVLAPFAALLLGNKLSKRWPAIVRVTLYVATLVVSVISPAIYGYFILWPRQSTPAAPFVLVPPVTGLFSVIAVALAAIAAHRGASKL